MWVGIGVGIGRNRFAQDSGIFAAYAARVAADGGVTEAGACVDAVTGLLLNASLLLVPSGYKANKLYSEIPTNGNGDLTWTRGSTANRTNSSGLLESMATGVPRLTYQNGGCPALLLEPQRTNLVLRSEEFDNASWTKSDCTLTSNNDIAPDGTMSADRLVPNGNNSLHRIISTIISTTIGQSYSVSLFVKKNDFDFFYFREGIGTFNNSFFNISNGTIGTVAVGRSAKIEDYGNGWYRCSISTTASTTSSQVTFGFSESDNVANFIGNNVKYNILWGAQLEAGAYPSTYIPTTSATATRVADSASKTGISSLIGQTEGVLFWEGIVMQQTDIVAINRSTVNGIYINKGAGNLFRTAIYNSSNVIQFADTIVRNTNTKIAIAYKSGDSAMFVNGSKIGSTNTTAITFNGALSEIRLNDDFLIATAPQFTNKIAIYNTRLTDAECQTLTTL